MFSEKQLRFGIVGVGRGAALAKLLSRLPQSSVAGICALDQKRARSLAEELPGRPRVFASYEEMIRSGEVEAVFIATPPMLHVEQSIMALERGIHVLCEVPALHSFDEWRPLREAAEKSRAIYRIAENVNYFGPLVQVAAMSAAGVLGEIIYAYGEYLHDVRSLHHDSEGRPTWRAAYPSPIHYCTHELGPILMILKDRIVSVSAHHSGEGCGMSGTDVAVYRTARGTLIVERNDFSSPRPDSVHNFVIQGVKGVAEVGFGRGGRNRYFLEAEKSRGWQELAQAPAPFAPRDESTLPAWAMAGGHGTIEYYMVQDFISAVRTGARWGACDVYDALEMSLPGIVAARSIRQGGAQLDLPDVRRGE